MIRWVTTDPQVLATWTDKQMLAAYSLTRGTPDDDEAKAVAAEMLRRGFPL